MKDLLKKTEFKVFMTFFVAATFMSLTTEVNPGYGFIEGGKIIIFIAISLMGFVYAYFIAEQDVNRTIRGAHVIQWILRAIFISSLPLILFINNGQLYVLLVGLSGGTSFYLMFDWFYNKMKGYDYSYVGREAILDRLVRFLGIQRFYFMIRLIIWMSSHVITIVVL
jgi:hypothetical protein